MSKKCILLFIVAAMICCILAGCSTQGAQATETKETEQTQSVTNTGEAASGGVYRISTKTSYMYLGVPMATTQSHDWIMSAPAIESLARLNAAGEVVPWLAKEITMDSEQKQIKVVLNEGIEFHDGTPFNAEAVKRNYEIAMEYGCSFTSSVESCEVVSEYELIIHLKDITNITLIDTVVDGGRMISPTYYDENGFDACVTFACGTGPYKMEQPASDTSIIYVKNDNYWIDGKPYLDGIEWILCGDESTAMTILQSGEANAIYAATADDATLLVDSGDYRRIGTNDAYYCQGTQCVFETDDPESPMYDVRVRQAFCYAIDRAAVVKGFGGDFRAPVMQLAQGGSTFSDKVVGYDYNPEKAKELLAEAGYADGCDITITYIAGSQNIAVMLQGYLEEVGFKVNMNLAERAIWEECKINDSGTKYEDVLFSYIGYALSPMSQTFGENPRDYSAQWDKETVEKLQTYFDVMYRSSDAAEVQEATDNFQTLLIDEACLLYPNDAYATILIAANDVHDMGFCETHSMMWTPESTYLAK